VALAAAFGAACVAVTAGCTSPDDQGRPGFPRTARTPIAGAAFPYAEPEDVGLSADDIWRFKERLYSRVVARHVVGSEILVIVDGRIVLHQAMGWADRDEGRPLERNSIFRIASMTKPVAGTAALFLVDEGRLGLDSLVGRYLPEFRTGRSAQITVRQLLLHRSGFVEGSEPDGYEDEPTLRAAVRLAGDRGPDYPSGEQFIYSGLNSETLGAIVQQVTGMPVERFMEERVFTPLGLVDTHVRFDPAAPWANRVPSSYRTWVGPWERYWNPARPPEETWFSPAGDLFASAIDYAVFLQAWMARGAFEDARLLEPATVEAALADPAAGDDGSPRPIYYGMHWEIYAPPGSPGQLPVFGHRGATGALALAIPDRNAIVIYLTNSTETEVVDEVIALALELFRG
jgi:CubicO group peptidase (beta-lactamase class C family)